MLIWLGKDGFAPGYAVFGLGWIVAMEVEDRLRLRHALPKAKVARRKSVDARR